MSSALQGRLLTTGSSGKPLLPFFICSFKDLANMSSCVPALEGKRHKATSSVSSFPWHSLETTIPYGLISLPHTCPTQLSNRALPSPTNIPQPRWLAQWPLADQSLPAWSPPTIDFWILGLRVQGDNVVISTSFMEGGGLPGAPHSPLGSHRHFSSCRYWLNLAENKQSVNRILADTINSCRFLQP